MKTAEEWATQLKGPEWKPVETWLVILVRAIQQDALEEALLKVKWWKGRPMSDDRLLKFIIEDVSALMQERK